MTIDLYKSANFSFMLSNYLSYFPKNSYLSELFFKFYKCSLFIYLMYINWSQQNITKLENLHHQWLLIQDEEEGASFNDNNSTQKETGEPTATPGEKDVSHGAGGK